MDASLMYRGSLRALRRAKSHPCKRLKHVSQGEEPASGSLYGRALLRGLAPFWAVESRDFGPLWQLERHLINHFLITDYIELSLIGRDLRRKA
jgi:hypothetical protein